MPDLPEGRLTIVATHLENRTSPKGRRKQAEEVLEQIRPIHNPVIVAGDMNTSGMDGSVSSFKAIAKKGATSPLSWAVHGIETASGVGIVFGLSFDVAKSVFKQNTSKRDPTASGIPVLAENHEAEFFKNLDRFRFEDGIRLDLRGEPDPAEDHETDAGCFTSVFSSTRRRSAPPA